MIKFNYHENQLITKSGDVSTCLIILNIGEVDCKLNDGTLLKKIKNTGTILGIMYFFGSVLRTANIFSTKKTDIYSISFNAIKEILGDEVERKFQNMVIKSILAENFYFKTIAKALKNDLLDHFELECYKKKDVIFEYGSFVNDNVTIIVEGEIIDDNKVRMTSSIGKVVQAEDVFFNITRKFEKNLYSLENTIMASMPRPRLIYLLGGNLMEIQEKLYKSEFLGSLELFNHLGNEYMERISEYFHKETFNNEFIYSEKTPGNKFYIVKDGKVKIKEMHSEENENNNENNNEDDGSKCVKKNLVGGGSSNNNNSNANVPNIPSNNAKHDSDTSGFFKLKGLVNSNGTKKKLTFSLMNKKIISGKYSKNNNNTTTNTPEDKKTKKVLTNTNFSNEQENTSNTTTTTINPKTNSGKFLFKKKGTLSNNPPVEIKKFNLDLTSDCFLVRLCKQFFGEACLSQAHEEPRKSEAKAEGYVEVYSIHKSDWKKLFPRKTYLRDYLHTKLLYIQDDVSIDSLSLVQEIKMSVKGGSFIAISEHNVKYDVRVYSKQAIQLDDTIYHEVKFASQILGSNTIENPFIPRLVNNITYNNFLLQVYVNYSGKDLFEVLKYGNMGNNLHRNSNKPNSNIINYNVVKFWTACILLSLKSLHKIRVIYRDLKPENIILLRSGYPMLNRFEVSTILYNISNGKTHSVKGTPHYMAPEMVFDSSGYGISVDYWSLGVCLYEFICGRLPFGEDTDDPKEVYNSVLNDDLRFPSNVNDFDYCNLVKRLLDKHISNRETNYEILKNHPFFKGIEWNILEDLSLKAPYFPECVYSYENGFNSKNLNKNNNIGNNKGNNYKNKPIVNLLNDISHKPKLIRHSQGREFRKKKTIDWTKEFD